MNTQFIKDNVVVGVYTNKEKYLTRFVKNFNTLYPDVELIYNVYDANINSNMEILRRDFAKTNKRYWLFLDDDILFCDKNTIGVALLETTSLKNYSIGINRFKNKFLTGKKP